MDFGKIAVLDGGPGGHATAADLVLRGFEVYLWARNPSRLAAVFQSKKIKVVGGVEDTVQLAGASDDLANTLKGAKLVLICLPATAQREMAEKCAPFLEDGQVIMTCSQGGMGSVEFARVLRDKGIKKDVICTELPGIPIGGRFLEAGVVNLVHDYRTYIQTFSMLIGVFPAKRSQEALETISQVYPGIDTVESSLASALIARGIIHQPLAVLANIVGIETFMHFWDIADARQIPSVRRLIICEDNERKSIEAAWGFKIMEIYRPSYISGQKADRDSFDEMSPVGPRAQYRIRWAWEDRLTTSSGTLDTQHRYVNEAVPCGLVVRSSAAHRAGVQTPVTDSVINLFSAITGVDYFQTGRTLDSLGFEVMGVEETKRVLYEGWD